MLSLERRRLDAVRFDAFKMRVHVYRMRELQLECRGVPIVHQDPVALVCSLLYDDTRYLKL